MMQALPPQRSWTREEYGRLTELGFFTGERVELIEGRIVTMAPMTSPHATAIGLAADALTPAVGPGSSARVRMPLAAGDRSEPEPDLAIVAGLRRAYATAHPTTAALVVEVADSSVEYDRDVKGSRYARANVAGYWIVNRPERQIEIYRRPAPDPDACAAWRYAERRIARPGETVSPLAALAVVVAVDDLLP